MPPVEPVRAERLAAGDLILIPPSVGAPVTVLEVGRVGDRIVLCTDVLDLVLDADRLIDRVTG